MLDIFVGVGVGRKEGLQWNGRPQVFFVPTMKSFDAFDYRRITSSAIAIDHETFTCYLPELIPKRNWKKAEMQEACTARGIPFRASDLRFILREQVT